eukprot:6978561-Lingulodinium_polyedra.AAC.1
MRVSAWACGRAQAHAFVRARTHAHADNHGHTHACVTQHGIADCTRPHCTHVCAHMTYAH